MQVVVDDTQVVLNRGDVSVTLQDNHKVWVDDHHLAVVKCPDFTLDDLRAQINALILQMQGLVTDGNDLELWVQNAISNLQGQLDYKLSDVYLTTLFNGILNVAISTLNGDIDAINAWLLNEVGGLHASVDASYSVTASIINAAVAELSGNIAASYSTNQALAEVVDGVTHLRAEAATFATVTMANGQKAISGWKAVADTNEPSAMYVYADTFYVVSPVNGEIKTVYPITFVGEFSAHPLPSGYSDNSVYKNTVNGHSYILSGGAWIEYLKSGTDGIAGTNGVDGTSTYTWVKYASDINGTGLTDFPAGMSYLGIAYNKSTSVESTNPADYTWSLIKGTDGIAGTNGVDGVTNYTWIKYADTAAGAGMSDSSTGKLYIGIAVNKTTATESSTAGDYTWSLIKGTDGTNGTNGTNGARGAGFFHGTASSWSDAAALSAITSTGATRVHLDKVTLSSGIFSATKYWDQNQGLWVTATLYVDGNLVVNGTITSASVAASNLTMATGMSGRTISGSFVNGTEVVLGTWEYTLPSAFITGSKVFVDGQFNAENSSMGTSYRGIGSIIVNRVRSGTPTNLYNRVGVQALDYGNSASGEWGLMPVSGLYVDWNSNFMAGDKVQVIFKYRPVSGATTTTIGEWGVRIFALNKTI